MSSAVAALVGVIVGSLFPLLGQLFQRREDRRVRYEQARRETYADYLTMLVSFPNIVRQHAFSENAYKVVAEIGERMSPLHARLLLDAPPEVRTRAKDVSAAFDKLVRDRESLANGEKSRNERESMYNDDYGEAFVALVVPSIEALADAMGEDLRKASGK